MWKYTTEDLDRYSNMLPKADYSCLEKFLRSVDTDSLVSLRNAGLNIQNNVLKPHEQIFIITVLGNIFINEYQQKEFSRQDYIKLYPIFMTSVYYESIYRYKKDLPRIKEWRELRPNQIDQYRSNHEEMKKYVDKV